MFLRYVIVGTFITLLDFTVTLTTAKAVHYLIANTLGFVIANGVQFVINHTWVFRRALEGNGALGRTYLFTLAISLTALSASNLGVWVGVSLLGLQLVYAKVLVMPVVLAINYGGRRLLVYR
jgi:putative flippase GtrA